MRQTGFGRLAIPAGIILVFGGFCPIANSAEKYLQGRTDVHPEPAVPTRSKPAAGARGSAETAAPVVRNPFRGQDAPSPFVPSQVPMQPVLREPFRMQLPGSRIEQNQSPVRMGRTETPFSGRANRSSFRETSTPFNNREASDSFRVTQAGERSPSSFSRSPVSQPLKSSVPAPAQNAPVHRGNVGADQPVSRSRNANDESAKLSRAEKPRLASPTTTAESSIASRALAGQGGVRTGATQIAAASASPQRLAPASGSRPGAGVLVGPSRAAGAISVTPSPVRQRRYTIPQRPSPYVASYHNLNAAQLHQRLGELWVRRTSQGGPAPHTSRWLSDHQIQPWSGAGSNVYWAWGVAGLAGMNNWLGDGWYDDASNFIYYTGGQTLLPFDDAIDIPNQVIALGNQATDDDEWIPLGGLWIAAAVRVELCGDGPTQRQSAGGRARVRRGNEYRRNLRAQRGLRPQDATDRLGHSGGRRVSV
jgi:hypothetical protein